MPEDGRPAPAVLSRRAQHAGGDTYWAVLDAGDRWVTAGEVAAAARIRWTAAGALHPVHTRA